MRYKARRQYSPAFKRRAVEQSLASEETQAVVAGKLGISAGLLTRWRREFLMSADETTPPVKNRGPSKSLSQLERENARLKKRLKRAELENEILKKADEYFTKDPE